MNVNICGRLINKGIECGINYYNKVNGGIHSWMIPKGLYAIKDYKKDDIIHRLSGKIVLNPTKESIHVGNNMHIIDEYGKYINHSFQPNTRIEANVIIAITDIKVNEEITFNYNESEVNMDYPFEDEGILVCGKKI